MQRHLYLMRHAEAEDKVPNRPDKDRELTPAGIRQSLQIATYCLQQKFIINSIYTSSARRAQQTAFLVADVIKCDHSKVVVTDELYDASTRTFLAFINDLDDSCEHILCVGHNPTLTYLAEYVTGSEIGDISTAGLVSISFDRITWRDVSQRTGQFLQYVDSKLIQPEP